MKKEENKNEEVVEETTELMVKGFGELNKGSKTVQENFTNITDEKKLFNLDAHVDYKINDCKGEKIRVKEVLIKRFTKPLDEPEVDENGEITKEFEIKLVTVLIDDNNKSYVTASKTFAIQMMRYINMFGTKQMETDGLEIKIIETPVKNSNNKALGFELV